MACSENKNPLQRGGTSQQQRLLAAIQRGYVRIDERDYADWIVFAGEFAARLNYYDASNSLSGNWKPFFENDISAVLGTIALQDIDTYRRAVSERFALLKGDEFLSNITLKRETLGDLFGCILALCKALDNMFLKVPGTIALHGTLQNLVRLKLQPALYKLLAYYKGGKALNLVREKDHPDWKLIGVPVRKAAIRIAEGLSSHWIVNAATWEDYYNVIPEDQSIYGDPAWNNHRRINHAANHNLFSGLFDQFLLSYSKVISDAENSLQQTLSAWNGHLPHYALFLSFLKLFRHARDHANTFTQRHLDFYYKDVLQLFPQKAAPNSVHVIIELAKQADSYLLPQGTLVKAGKDSLGKEVNYALDRDVVFNKAKVAKLMAVYRATAAANHGTIVNAGRLFASPVANSADGLGAPLESPYKEWHPLVNKKYTDGALSAIAMPKATAGFAVASHYLALAEGERLVSIKFAPAFTAAQHSALNNAACYLTAEKEWVKVSGFSWGSGILTGTVTAASVLTFTLAGDVPAITNYDAKVHGGTFQTGLPLLKVVLTNEDNAAYGYDSVKDIVITTVEVEVKVGLNATDSVVAGGLKNLALSNDTGVLDPSKPFFPFGQAPKKGASFIIGSAELFRKKNAKLFIRVEWKDLPEYAYMTDFNSGPYSGGGAYTDLNPKVKGYTLQQGAWQPIGGADMTILSDFETDDVFDVSSYPQNPDTLVFPTSLLNLPDGAILSYQQPDQPFGVTTVNGFLKLTLAEGFGHQQYQKALTKYLIDLANGGSTSEPIEPYTPQIKKISLHYKASSVQDLSMAGTYAGRSVQFFHVYPFGDAEQHKKLSNTGIRLLSQS